MLILPPWSFWIPYRCYFATFWWLLIEYIPRKIKRKFLQPRNYCLFLFESGVAKSNAHFQAPTCDSKRCVTCHIIRKNFLAKLDFLYTDLFVNDHNKSNVACLADNFFVCFFSYFSLSERYSCARQKTPPPPGGREGVLPFERLMGMCCWMGSHFHDWIEYDGAAFSIELLEWGRTFSDFLG